MKTMQYVYSLPTSASFTDKGLSGYTFGPLNQRDLEIYYIEVEKGHDTFMISKKIARIYYVLSGNGYFTIADRKYDVSPGMLVEVPPKVEYCYSGKMRLIALSRPRWFSGNDTFTKWNPDVVPWGDLTCAADRLSWSRLVKLRVFGKSPISAYLRLNQRFWNKLPASFTALSPISSYGHFLHTLARIQGARAQAFSTFSLRNRPQLELIRRLLERSKTDTLRVAILGCSTGAEAYSVAWRIRSAMFERMTRAEIDELFDKDGDILTVKSWIKEGIEWNVGDVGEPKILGALGPQDMVVANNFLCHMDASMAERCLRNIARLVSPHGYLFVSGIDLDIRTKVADDLGWSPLRELLEEIHEGDPCMRSIWPCHYGAFEPLNKRRPDWRIRYAAAFQLAPSAKDTSQ